MLKLMMHTGGRSLITPSVWLAVSVMLVACFNVWSTFHLDLDGDSFGIGIEQMPFSDRRPTKLDLGKMTESLLDSFTAVDKGTHTIMPRKFPRHMVTTTNPNPSAKAQRHHQTECECDVLSVDCIDYIACIPTSDNHRHALVHLGIETRSAMKRTAKFEGYVQDSTVAPVGKSHQYAAMAAWNSWVVANILPKQYALKNPHDFVNETFYPSCRETHRKGKSCFFTRITDPEDVRRGVMEKKAIKWFSDNKYGGKNEVESMRTMLQDFITKQRRQLQHVHAGREKALSFDKSHDGVTLPTSSMSPLGQLMVFSHLIRLLFQPRPFLLDIYEEKLTTVKPTHEQQQDQTSTAPSPFTISVHMRRGDSCHFDDDLQHYPYEREASSLQSPAQTSNVRRCYQTAVYLKVLERIRDLVPKNRPLHVYLSTDDTGNVMKEIAANHTHVYKNVVDEWHYLDYSRAHFQYDLTEFIESDANHNRPVMGETAVTDLWLLSHGQAFIGHLGSRFGKVAWYLATSRHNSFIPYFSVDGHSKFVQPQALVQLFLLWFECFFYSSMFTRHHRCLL
jgi:hypothetical protein